MIYNNKCKMPDFHHWHYEAKKANMPMHISPSKIPSLVTMNRRGNKVFLNLNRSVQNWDIGYCTACLVKRNMSSFAPDNNVV